ncbi:MAG: mandelate racemase [Alphaproteobacteria bacterium]|nr:mandelate racemase [Alphaproteobacteria bacterium]
MATADLRVRGLRARAVMAPLRRRLATATGGVTQAPLVLLDLETEEGLTGVGYVFLPHAAAMKPLVVLLEEMLPLIKGMEVAPVAIEQSLRKRFTLLGGTGLVTLAIAAIDIACWDALAKAAGLPLVRLLGGEKRRVRAYNSTGLGIMGPERAAREAVELLEFGFTAIKLRLGYPTPAEDVAVTRAVMKAVPRGTIVMSDYNQALSVPEAIRRGQALDGEDLYWIEEPTRADDFEGNAAIARAVETPVQIGENFWSERDFQKALAAGSCDYAMPDVTKIGGVTAWMRAAALAEAHGMPLSSHLFAEVSAHLMCAAPTAHFLEYMDWADPVLAEPCRIEDGHIVIPDRPGNGMAWDEARVAKLLVG